MLYLLHIRAKPNPKYAGSGGRLSPGADNSRAEPDCGSSASKDPIFLPAPPAASSLALTISKSYTTKPHEKAKSCCQQQPLRVTQQPPLSTRSIAPGPTPSNRSLKLGATKSRVTMAPPNSAQVVRMSASSSTATSSRACSMTSESILGVHTRVDLIGFTLLTIRTVRQYGAIIREIYHPSSSSDIKPTTNTIV